MPAPMLMSSWRKTDSGLDVQEFMVVPVGVKSFAEALRAGAEIYQTLKKDLAAMGMVVAVGDEGGFAPHLKDHVAALEQLKKAVAAAGYADSARLAIDAASSEFFKAGTYTFEKKPCTAEQMAGIYGEWIAKYGLVSLEDPLAEDDWAGWRRLTDQLGQARSSVLIYS